MDGGARRSGSLRPSGSTSVLTTTLAACRPEATPPPQPRTKATSRAVPAVCIQPDASIVVALKQRSCASSLQDQSPRSVGLEPVHPAPASEPQQTDDTLQSPRLLRGQRSAAQLARASQSDQRPSRLSTQWSRPSATAQLTVRSARPPSGLPPKAVSVALEPSPSAPTVPAHAPHWDDQGQPSNSPPCPCHCRSRLSCPALSSGATDAPADPMYPSGCVPFSRLPARSLPSRASDSRLHLWLQNDVLNSHSCV